MLTKQRQAEFKALKADDGATQPGEFEALVAVFDNVDNQGDRIKSGAFDETLAAWRKSGDPIPIVLAHEWSDPWAHIGYAMPEDVKAVPGRGLYVSKGVLDIEDNPVAKQVHRLMERRTLKEFSFGYRIPEGGERKADDGAYDLTNLDLIEFGPCLKGVNDSTELLAVKSLVEAENRRESGEEPTLEARMDRIEALMLKAWSKKTAETTTVGEKGPEVVTPPAGTEVVPEAKAWLDLEGTFEKRASELREAIVTTYGREGDPEYWVSVEGTYPDRVIYCVSDNAEQTYFSVPYTIGDDGVVLGTPEEVEVEAVVTPKSDEEIETPAETEDVETKAHEEVEATPEEPAEVLPEDAEKPEAELEGKTEEDGSGEASAREKSAEIDLMLRMQALDNLEAELGFKQDEEETPVETKSLEEMLAETEDEFRDPMPFDVGEVRLKQMTENIEALEGGELRDVINKDQTVEDAQRALESTEKELKR